MPQPNVLEQATNLICDHWLNKWPVWVFLIFWVLILVLVLGVAVHENTRLWNNEAEIEALVGHDIGFFRFYVVALYFCLGSLIALILFFVVKIAIDLRKRRTAQRVASMMDSMARSSGGRPVRLNFDNWGTDSMAAESLPPGDLAMSEALRPGNMGSAVRLSEGLMPPSIVGPVAARAGRRASDAVRASGGSESAAEAAGDAARRAVRDSVGPSDAPGDSMDRTARVLGASGDGFFAEYRGERYHCDQLEDGFVIPVSDLY